VAPPLGALYLAAVVEERRLGEVEVIDMNLLLEKEEYTEENCVKIIADHPGADIYGFTIQSPQFMFVEAMVKWLKKNRPTALVCVGGPHVSSLPDETLCLTGADAAFISEGELAFCDYLSNGQGGGVFQADLINDLDSIPYPARHKVDFSKYERTMRGETTTNMITSRGCPFKCAFCSWEHWGRKTRFRSAENILGEVDEIYETLGIKNILFLDDTLTLRHDRIYKLCEGLEKRHKERGSMWRGWTRVDRINQELLDIMGNAGFYALCFGIESGSQRMLDVLQKGTTIEQNIAAIQMCKEAGIKARTTIMVGIPTETFDEVKATGELLRRAQPDDWLLSVFTPIVGCDAWRHPDKFGLKMISEKNDLYLKHFCTGYDERSGHAAEQVGVDWEEIAARRDWLFGYLKEHVPRELVSR
jgi:anaerobic magnesium-protoporphyrin IX monomethyl ester cyclase